MMCTLRPLGMAQDYTRIIRSPRLSARPARLQPMLRNLKRWWSAATPKPGLQGIDQWAQSKGASCRRVRDNEGFVIDGAHRGVPWRIEWGPSQRPYITGNEVRFMAELGLH